VAKLVIAAATPHTPVHPKEVLAEGPTSETGALYARVAEQLAAAAPDLIVIFDSDHFVNFFFDNMPAFCIGIVDQAEGPDETRVEMPRYRVPVHEQFARKLFHRALDAEFDVSSKEEMVLDHSVLVPLHFLTPRMQIPIVPVYIRGLTPPLPLARRCLALGRMVGDFIRSWPGPERVAVLASGSISHEVGGPRMGQTDQEWLASVVELLRAGQSDELATRATTERMVSAGNVSGELLNWIALLGAIGACRPTFLEPQHGHAYAVWHPE
jgi:protocatechuate 4,5-dioxygenase beta chain